MDVALAQSEGTKSASELLAAGEVAYNKGDWRTAAGHFEEFLTGYSGLPGTQPTVDKLKPLLAMCQVRLADFEKALPLLEAALRLPMNDPKLRMDLMFFNGTALLRAGKTEAARRQLAEIYADPAHERTRRMESLILGGMTYLIEKNWKDASAFFEKYATEIRHYNPEAGARAELLLLYSLIQEKRWDDAGNVAAKLSANPEHLRQIVTFFSLLVDLGTHFLEVKEPYKAIAALRQVPAKAEIERMQKSLLALAEAELAAVGKHPVRASQLQTSISEMRRELEAFEPLPQLDSAVRLRMAEAYFQLGKTREACLILDQMVRQMEPDAMVEAATASLLRGWMSLERYKRAVRTADLYQERCMGLAEKPNLAEVLFLRAQALEGQFFYQEAADSFRDVAEKFRNQSIAARAGFMSAYNILQLERYREAADLFDRQARSLGKEDEMRPHVLFWRAMAFYFNQEWEPCREQLESYLREYPAGEYADDAYFRIAYSHFSEARYPEAVKRLAIFAEDYPQSEWLAEALLTLGDARAAEGDLDGADRAYAAIGVEAAGFHDEGWMKRGNLLKMRKNLPGMTRLFQDFLAKRPESSRMAEALQWLGWVAKQEGRVDDARRIYWDAISRFGNEAARPGVEEMFLALESFYRGPDRMELTRRWQDEMEKAKASGKSRYATRLGWVLAQQREPGVAPEAHAATASQALAALAPHLIPRDTAPRILADVGDALAATGDPAAAQMVYEGLRKWWPRAPERDRAYAGLGFIALAAGREEDALRLFDRYEKTSVMPRTPSDDQGVSLVEGELGGKVTLARAGVLSKNHPSNAHHLLHAVQRTKSMPARVRADAFLAAGRLHVKNQQLREALPYFEQVYLLFNRFPELVAHAYFERGAALEKMHERQKAREVYSELAQRQDLQPFKPAKLGLLRAEALGGVIPVKPPVGGFIPPDPLAQ